MITIIPSLEVIKANVDNNIQGDGAVLRRVAFDVATELMSLSSSGVLSVRDVLTNGYLTT